MEVIILNKENIKILIIFSFVIILVYLIRLCFRKIKYYQEIRLLELKRHEDVADIIILTKIDDLIKEIRGITIEILEISLGNTQDPSIRELLKNKIKEREKKQKQLYSLVKKRS